MNMATRVRLNLKRHCIETEIKRCYNAAVAEYFKAGPSVEQKDLERRIDLLHHGLKVLDFGNLRNRFPELCGGSDADVDLEDSVDRGLTIRINGVTIYAEH